MSVMDTDTATTSIQFTIKNYKLTKTDSLNEIYSSKHWRGRNEYAKGIHLFVNNAMKHAGLTKAKDVLFNDRVDVVIEYPEDGLDIDNHGYFSKCIIDAMKGVVVKDDNPKRIKSLYQTFADRDNILVTVVMVEDNSD